jgi:hypothetical protein
MYTQIPVEYTACVFMSEVFFLDDVGRIFTRKVSKHLLGYRVLHFGRQSSFYKYYASGHCFGDWNMSPSSGKTYSVGHNR